MDDHNDERGELQRLLEQHEYVVQPAANANEALAVSMESAPDVVMVTLGVEDAQPGFFKEVRSRMPQASIVALGDSQAQSTLERALRAGADRYLARPIRERAFLLVMQRAMEKPTLARRAAAIADQPVEPHADGVFDGLIGSHPTMQQLFNRVLQAAKSKATVLIHGETGTGKELIAAAIHKNSARRAAPFVRLNCAALAESVLESELFGHEKGAFTGAGARRQGRFEQAQGGTLFLDEVSEVSKGIQVKLLRFLQERELERVGGNDTIKLDVRVVAATNRDLKVMVEDKTFREDLYYRLNVVRLDVPPLRARPNDIALLADYFLQRFADENDEDVQGFSQDALRRMLEYPWPGNVRELQNVVEQAVVLASGPLVEAESLPIQQSSPADQPAQLMIPGATLAELERFAIIKTLEAVDGSRSKAAEMLGISRRTLQYRLQEWGIEPRRKTAAAKAGES